jgi:hypothetical protein
MIYGPGTPERKIQMPDGTVRTEKLCPIPCNIKMVDAQGNVVTVPLANNWVDRNPNAEYGQFALQQALKAGFIPYAECPVATGRLPPDPNDKKDKACTGKFTKDKCCHHVEKVIRARRKVQYDKTMKFQRAMETNQDKMVRQYQEQLAGKSADAAERQSGKGLSFGE